MDPLNKPNANEGNLFEQKTFPEEKKTSPDILLSGTKLEEEKYLISTNKEYYAEMQNDGNFVVYKGKSFLPKNAIWSTSTNGLGKAPYHCILEETGNLKLYDARPKTLWQSYSANKGIPPYYLQLRDNGSLIIIDSSSKEILVLK